ncbi:serine/threonine protein kinase [Saprolegnia parasitica CBS 223.65]|uniref:Serine/threonine protein kinase n=1 Tax=Saprolegnia parasitica (strain CBS 223.65) TaxID=695850 RepID=A0A067C0L1_SAPPC|nr:serine/threonine protein kinase [Saprolegnia parasitica CBS 223.65]KDO24309.1 serine/threonine protein kinase [Saprolegnia parasitica CBS 223.65]|eukprot:XP_012204906.1 serine/threonine protein kinase [Saprolegnia parasitica CBS 223.65]
MTASQPVLLDASTIEEDGGETYLDNKLVFLKSHDRVAEEAEVLLSDSSFFITPIGIVETPECKTLVLPFLAASKNLRVYLRSLIHPSSLASDAVAHITWRLAMAIAHLHAHGIAHTQLSSQCVLVTSHGSIKLCGLGSHESHAKDASLRADVLALLDVLGELLTRATELQKGCSFAMPAPPAWLLGLANDASKYTSISDVIHELERHNAHHGVVYVNDHHGVRLSVAKALESAPEDTPVLAKTPIVATTVDASMSPTPATLSELWTMYDVPALDSTLLSCTAEVEGTDGSVLLRRGVYNGKDVIIHRMNYAADVAFTQHLARVLWAQSDVCTPRVLGHGSVNSDKIASAALSQVQETVPCLVVDCDGSRSLHDVIANQWLHDDPHLWKRKIKVARAILVGLLDCIARGIRHVDVTSHNVFLKPDLETPQFMNVGGRRKGADGVFSWYPPELHPGGVGLTWTTDVFVFGTLLYEIATSHEPHRDEDRELALQTLLITRGARGDCPTGLVLLIAACLRHSPAERPTLQATLERLDHLLVHAPLDLAMDGDINLIELDTTRLAEQSVSHSDGTTGTVTIKGTYMSQKVLIKRPDLEANVRPPDIYAPLLREVSLLARVQSPFVINMWGVAYFASCRPAVVFEHSSEDDNLWQLLRDASFNRVLTDADRRLLLLGAAQGLGDVHGRDWIHCDLRPENYLVGSHGQLQLGQFGAARHIHDTSTPLPIVSPAMLPFAAPEVLGAGTFSKASDVYAFGALIAQLYARERLYASSTLTAVAIRERVPLGLAKIEMPEACPPALKALAKRCVSFTPSERPSMDDVVASLRELVVECTVTSAPELPTHHAPTCAAPSLPTVNAALELDPDNAPLGAGGLGVVSLCYYKGVKCALKTLRLEDGRGPFPTFRKIRMVNKFRREMELLARLTKEKAEYVPRFIANLDADSSAYLMELVPGNDLSKELWYIKQQATFPWTNAARWRSRSSTRSQSSTRPASSTWTSSRPTSCSHPRMRSGSSTLASRCARPTLRATTKSTTSGHGSGWHPRSLPAVRSTPRKPTFTRLASFSRRSRCLSSRTLIHVSQTCTRWRMASKVAYGRQWTRRFPSG